MNHLKMSLSALCLIVPMLALAQPMEMPEEDKTLSPYFVVKSDDPSVDRLPLLSTKADVSIAGVIADVRVTQVYKNDGKKPIEAIYTFPASTRAAVYAMKMTIGDRTIVAKIREREKARKEYEQAKQEDKSASLLEQQRPNVFQMNVANIMPGDFITVEMSYTELLVPTEGVYEFAYPTVVGPRYSNVSEKDAPKSEHWVASPYQHEGEMPSYTFGVAVDLSCGLPIQEITCPSHKTTVKYTGLNSAAVRLDESEKAGGNRDFILRYRLAGGKIESGLLLYQGKDENFFLLMLQPPKRVELAQIPPREYIFIIDVSGSMHGFPLDISKILLRNLFANLRPTDWFNVLLFSGDNAALSEQSLPATKENLEKAIKMIDEEQGSGGTELLPALQRALALPPAKGTSRSFVIATDGYVTVETEAFDLIRKNLGDANFFAFGIGSGVNRFIMEGMARVGMGEPFIIEKPEAAAAQAEKFRKYIQSPVLTDINVSFPGFDAYDVEPEHVPDVLAERPIIISGKWRGTDKGAIKVTGMSAQGEFSQTVSVAEFPPNAANSALRYLWARHRIQMLADYNNLAEDSARVKEVTQLGLKYNLLTNYTSFIAVDQKVRNVGGKQEVVEQALPMPQGVSDYAVGGGAATGMAGRGYGVNKSAMPSMTRDGGAIPADALSEAEATPAPPPPIGTVKVGKVEIQGGMTERAVKQPIEKQLAELVSAYSTELSSQPGLHGKMVVEFTVGANGLVRDVKVTLSELTPNLEQAVIQFLKKLTITNSTGSDATVKVTFNFKP
ncbi:MAG: TonB family protein [candidate division WOR-3 bacterium]|nr:TonB family protein [candidate division WOR-3 bacterium]